MPAVTLGQVLAIICGLAAFFAIVAGAFRMGGVTQRVESMEQNVIDKLTELTARFAAFQVYIDEATHIRQEWTGWRSHLDGRMDAQEAEATRIAKNVHDLRDHINAHGMQLAVIADRRKNEPSDRRVSE
jgi:hypothetical protein